MNRMLSVGAAIHMHVKARCSPYPGTTVMRADVPVGGEDWALPCPAYAPVCYTAPVVLAGPNWADPEGSQHHPVGQLRFNDMDGNVDRKSHEGPSALVDGLPRNPRGRTGLCGRGLLGRWGPNHAADPILTRWAKNHDGTHIMVGGKRVLEFVAVQRRDSGEWAIPGGMVEPGDTISATLKKEFGEEALNTLDLPADTVARLERELDTLFAQGQPIYRGYVDDPRNTDNAWIETVAYNFHDDGHALDKIPLQAGDDAAAVQWMQITARGGFYASHDSFLKAVAALHGASY